MTNGTAANPTGVFQQGYVCGACLQWVAHGVYPHICQTAWPQPQQAPQGWRCSCAAYVLPGEEHRCFYRETVALLERIAKALERK